MVFHDIKSAKEKVLETHPYLQWSTALCQGTEKMLFLYCKLYDDKMARAFQTIL